MKHTRLRGATERAADLDGDVIRFEHGADVDAEMKSALTSDLVTEDWDTRLEFGRRRQRLGRTE